MIPSRGLTSAFGEVRFGDADRLHECRKAGVAGMTWTGHHDRKESFGTGVVPVPH